VRGVHGLVVLGLLFGLACHRKSRQAPAPAASRPTVVLLPSAGEPADGLWARGCARLMARQIDRATGRDSALVALVLGAASRRVGYALPSAPVALDQGVAAAKRYGATLFARVHIHSPSEDIKNILMDVFDVAKLDTQFSRVYPWNPHTDMPPLRVATIDLAGASGLGVRAEALLEGAPFVETHNAAALEAFLRYLDNLTLAAAARGRPVGASFRDPSELLDAALAADPGLSTARMIKAQGVGAHFDRVLVSEVPLKD